jgi:cytidylate kinase
LDVLASIPYKDAQNTPYKLVKVSDYYKKVVISWEDALIDATDNKTQVLLSDALYYSNKDGKECTISEIAKVEKYLKEKEAKRLQSQIDNISKLQNKLQDLQKEKEQTTTAKETKPLEIEKVEG